MSRNWSSKKGSGKDVNFQFKDEGQEVEGYYTGTLEGVGAKKNSTIHSLKTEDGKEINFWGSFVIDDQISKVEPGAYIMVKYHGKKKPKKGGNEYHDFELFVDEGATPAVPQTETATTAPAATVAEEEEDDLPF